MKKLLLLALVLTVSNLVYAKEISNCPENAARIVNKLTSNKVAAITIGYPKGEMGKASECQAAIGRLDGAIKISLIEEDSVPAGKLSITKQ